MYYQIFFILMVILYTAQLFPGGNFCKKKIERSPLPDIGTLTFEDEAYIYLKLMGRLAGFIPLEKGTIEDWKKLGAAIISCNAYRSSRDKKDLKEELGIDGEYLGDRFYEQICDFLKQELKKVSCPETIYSALTNWVKDELKLRDQNLRNYSSRGYLLQSAE